MGLHFSVYKQIIPGKKYFSHDITVVAIVFEIVLGSQVVETIGFGNVLVKGMGTVLTDDSVTILNEFKADLTT